MAYDDELAHRVRELLGEEEDIDERVMFGGLVFMVAGHMAIGISPRGPFVRVGADAHDDALALAHTRPMQMRGRPMRGWVRLEPEAIATKRALAAWVRRGVGFARTLPPKG